MASDAGSGLKWDASRFTRRRLLKASASYAAAVSGSAALLACASPAGGGSGTSPAATGVPLVKPKVDGDLSWFTWAQFVPPDIVTAFEKEYKVKVNQSFMSSDEEYVQKLAAGLPYDLITTNNGYMPQTLGAHLVQPFDFADLKNADQILPYFKAPFWDNGTYRYSVPYDYGPTGIMYRKNKVSNITNSWADMWNNPGANGHIYLLDAIGDTLGMSLLKNGFDCNSGDPAQVEIAVQDLLKLKPNVASFTTNQTPPTSSGDAWLMEGWATPIYQGLVAAPDPGNIGFYIPKEGSLMAADTLSIGAKAKAPGTALLFIDWILRNDNNAALANYILLKTGAKGGNDAFSTTIKGYPEFDYSDDLLKDQKAWKLAPTGARLQLWNQAWTRVKA